MAAYLENGKSRVDNLGSAFGKLVADLDIKDKSVLLKPNFTSCDHQLANTNPLSLSKVLEIISSCRPRKITVVEGSGESWATGKTTESTLKKFGAWDCIKSFGAEFIDLNKESSYSLMEVETTYGTDRVRVNKISEDYDVRISMTVPKSHDYAIMTSSTKNFAMPMVKPEDRVKIHGLTQHTSEGELYNKSVKLIHRNLSKLISIVKPTISVLDGFIGMEADGPLLGTPLNCGWALVSDDPVYCDCILAELIGINPMEVGYLNYLRKGKAPVHTPQLITKIGQLKKQFILHHNAAIQRNWK